MIKKVEVNNYVIFNDKHVDKKIVLLSDIHYYSKKDIPKLNNLYRYIIKINPDYICIAGDIFEESYVHDTDYFIDWLRKLGRHYKVIMILGNHDMHMSNIDSRVINYPLLASIKNIQNVYLLINDNVRCGRINFIGVNLPFKYYYKLGEDKNYLTEYLKHKKYSINNHDFNIMLCHSPISMLSNYDNIDLLKNIDLSLYGHMHGGLIPSIFKKISNHRGLINPKKRIFPKYCYGYIRNKKAIISTGVTKLSKNNPFHRFNFLYKSEIVVINIVSR